MFIILNVYPSFFTDSTFGVTTLQPGHSSVYRYKTVSGVTPYALTHPAFWLSGLVVAVVARVVARLVACVLSQVDCAVDCTKVVVVLAPVPLVVVSRLSQTPLPFESRQQSEPYLM